MKGFGSHLKTLNFIVCIIFYSLNCVIFSKETSCFWFCNFLCINDLIICLYLNKHKPWLELFFKFNQYSMRPFQRAWWGLIIFKFIEVLESLIWYLCLKYLVHTSKWRAQPLLFQFSL